MEPLWGPLFPLFRVPFGSSLGSPLGPLWGPLWVLFGIPSSPFSGSPLGSLWCPLWGLFGVPFGSSLGSPLGPFWDPLLPLFGVPMGVPQEDILPHSTALWGRPMGLWLAVGGKGEAKPHSPETPQPQNPTAAPLPLYPWGGGGRFGVLGSPLCSVGLDALAVGWGCGVGLWGGAVGRLWGGCRVGVGWMWGL